MQENVRFTCVNCGNTVEKDLLPGKHTVLGTLPVINRAADCCREPEYEDGQGYSRKMAEQSITDFIPGLRA